MDDSDDCNAAMQQSTEYRMSQRRKTEHGTETMAMKQNRKKDICTESNITKLITHNKILVNEKVQGKEKGGNQGVDTRGESPMIFDTV